MNVYVLMYESRGGRKRSVEAVLSEYPNTEALQALNNAARDGWYWVEVKPVDTDLSRYLAYTGRSII